MDERLRVERSRTFGGVAEVYDRTRPGYPADAVRWLVPGVARRVLELGAGTGKLTEALAAWGHEVVATDPSLPMLNQLTRHLATPVVAAGAERLPFRSATVDAVVVAQAFHWFDPATAVPEIARVLRPGGRVALVWNFRDESVPWVRRLTTIIGTEDFTDELQLSSLTADGHFEELDRAGFRCWQQLDREALLGLVASRSYVAALDEDTRSEVLARVSGLYDAYARPDGLRLPYRTECYRARVRPTADLAPRAEPPDGEHVLVDLR